MWIRALTVAATIALVFAAGVQAHPDRSCGLTPRVDGVRYDVKEVRGDVGCATVKRVATQFLRDGTVRGGWTCARGHGSSPFAASCAQGKQVLVRVLAPG
jgi:hypothetical protein